MTSDWSMKASSRAQPSNDDPHSSGALGTHERENYVAKFSKLSRATAAIRNLTYLATSRIPLEIATWCV